MILPNDPNSHNGCVPPNPRPTPVPLPAPAPVAAPPAAVPEAYVDPGYPPPDWKIGLVLMVEIPIAKLDAATREQAIALAGEIAAKQELVVTLGGVPLRARFITKS